MLNLNGITVRLGGRTILDGASAALPPGSRVGLIGRNGAGKSTLVRVIAGMLEPDDGSADMPKGARLGYIAQEAPSGTATPFDTVLAAGIEAIRANALSPEALQAVYSPARNRRQYFQPLTAGDTPDTKTSFSRFFARAAFKGALICPTRSVVQKM